MSPPSRLYSASAALILSKSLTELFPLLQPVKCGPTHFGFYCEFSSPQPMSEKLLTLIEEHMRAVAKADLEIHSTEILRTNAIDLFSHHKRPLLVERLSQQEDQLLSLGRIENFWEMIKGPFLETTSSIRAIKLLSLQETELADFEMQGFRIEGVAFESKEELKAFLKRWSEARKSDPLLHTLKRKVWCGVDLSDQVLWMPFGQSLKQLLLTPWSAFCQRWLIPVIHAPEAVSETEEELPIWAAVAFQYSDDPEDLYLPLLNPICKLSDHLHLQNSESVKKQLVELLQLQKKLANLFDLPVRWLATERPYWKNLLQEAEIEAEWDATIKDGIQLQFADLIGCYWKAGEIRRTPKADFTLSLLGPLERLIALLFERWKGELPLYLMPEQLRLFPVGNEALIWAKSVAHQLNQEGFRVVIDFTQGELRQRLRAVELYQPAYTAVIGPKEASKEVVTIRLPKGREEHLSMQRLRERLISDGGMRGNDLFGCMK